MKYFSTILTILGLYFFVYACAEKPCTDDGCEKFNELTIPEPLEDIRGEIQIEKLVIPVIQTESKDEFVYSLNECIDYLYANEILPEHRVPKELIVAQAAIETGWGKSRFANEGNNLFGIRTWNIDEPYLLPIPWTEWPGWGVKVFETKCDSVAYYIRMINEVFAYQELREVRAKIINEGRFPNGLDLAPTLTKYASRANYTELVATLIKYNIRGVYDL